MEKGLEELHLEDEEEDAFSFSAGEEAQNPSIGFCLVGCFLTASVVNFQATRNTLANLRHPLKGVQISDLGDNRYLFKFFNEVDIHRVITGALWTFNNHLLIFQRL